MNSRVRHCLCLVFPRLAKTLPFLAETQARTSRASTPTRAGGSRVTPTLAPAARQRRRSRRMTTATRSDSSHDLHRRSACQLRQSCSGYKLEILSVSTCWRLGRRAAGTSAPNCRCGQASTWNPQRSARFCQGLQSKWMKSGGARTARLATASAFMRWGRRVWCSHRDARRINMRCGGAAGTMGPTQAAGSSATSAGGVFTAAGGCVRVATMTSAASATQGKVRARVRLAGHRRTTRPAAR